MTLMEADALIHAPWAPARHPSPLCYNRHRRSNRRRAPDLIERSSSRAAKQAQTLRALFNQCYAAGAIHSSLPS